MQALRDPAPGNRLSHYTQAELASAVEGLGSAGGRIHAGIHQARKSIRRVRAALALGEPALGPGAGLIERQLRRLNRRLSPLRDAHALVETLDRLIDKNRHPEHMAFLKRARRVVAEGRAQFAHEARFGEEVANARLLLATLDAALQGLPWEEVTPAIMRSAMTTTTRRVADACTRAIARGHDEDWHRWRRRLRLLSQQHRAISTAESPSMFDKSLAEQLGVMQDLHLLRMHCGHDSPFSKSDRAALREFSERALERQRKRLASIETSPVVRGKSSR